MDTLREKIIRKNFDFLVTNYSFNSEVSNDIWVVYKSEKIIIQIFAGRATPEVELRLPDAPDFLKIDLGIVLESFEKITRDKYEESMWGHSLEENFEFVMSHFLELVDTLVLHPEIWWLNAQKVVYEYTERFYKKSEQDPTDDEHFYKLYKYIKSKDPLWKPKHEIPRYWAYLEKHEPSNNL